MKSKWPSKTHKPERETCIDCGVHRSVKPLHDYVVKSRAYPGIRCEECHRKLQRRYWKTSNARQTDNARYSTLFKKYGLTKALFERLLTSQNYKCAICGVAIADDHTCHVDHDHQTGKVRGLLCSRCNTGIGQFKDDPDLLLRAAAYLQRHHGEQHTTSQA